MKLLFKLMMIKTLRTNNNKMKINNKIITEGVNNNN